MKHLDQKATYELRKDAEYSCEQILEAAPHKTAAVRPLSSNRTNHSSKTSKLCWALLEKQDELLSEVLQRTPPTHGHTSVGGPPWTYSSPLCRYEMPIGTGGERINLY